MTTLALVVKDISATAVLHSEAMINSRTRCIIFLFCSILFVGTNNVSALAPSDVTVWLSESFIGSLV